MRLVPLWLALAILATACNREQDELEERRIVERTRALRVDMAEFERRRAMHPDSFDAATIARERQRQEAELRSLRAAEQRMREREERWKPFFSRTTVFWADVIAGALFGVIAGRIRGRNRGLYARGWAVLGGFVGALVGAAVFLPFILLDAIPIFWSTMPPVVLLGLTMLVIVPTGFVAMFGEMRAK